MRLTLLLLLCLGMLPEALSAKTETIEFVSDGNRLVGLLDTPDIGDARSLLVIVHGDGPTNVVQQNWYLTLRQRMTAIGISTFVWDKPGCGQSEGTYDADRAVGAAAGEVRAAIRHLRAHEVPGSASIGFWGISRAGWVVPLVIAQEPKASFWISVSGTDEMESFGYLLKENLRIEGRTEAETGQLYSEWMAANRVTQSGGTYEEVKGAAPSFWADPFMSEFFPEQTREEFERYQGTLLASNPAYDEETGLRLYVKDLDEVLRRVGCPVLAIFGEKDRNIDWRETMALYERTIGVHEPSRLTIETFADGNHNLMKCETGGWRETMANLGTAEPCDGYYDAMVDWLLDIGSGALTPVNR